MRISPLSLCNTRHITWSQPPCGALRAKEPLNALFSSALTFSASLYLLDINN